MATDRSKTTQKERIRRFMNENGSITSLQAMREFGCMRLAARIKDLKNEGMKISRTMEPGRNRYDEVIYYAKYTKEM